MPVDDPSDVVAEQRTLKKRVERLEAGTGGGGDSSHIGQGGDQSVALGYETTSTGNGSAVFGGYAHGEGQFSSGLGVGAWADGDESTAVGHTSYAGAYQSTAVGHDAFVATGHTRSSAFGADAETSASNQIMLGTSGDTVVVPGTFSNPSARHLKQNIIPAPELQDLFPGLTEWEYIDGDGRRRLGYIADELLGTDAERFVTFDDEGRPAGIDYLGLLVVQVARLNVRLAELERG